MVVGQQGKKFILKEKVAQSLKMDEIYKLDQDFYFI